MMKNPFVAIVGVIFSLTMLVTRAESDGRRSVDETGKTKPLEYRQITVNNKLGVFGLSGRTVEDNPEVYFTRTWGAQWDVLPKGNKWLIALRRYAALGEKPRFVGFAKKKRTDEKSAVVVLKREADDTCLWNIEFERVAVNSILLTRTFGRAKVTTGDYEGCYLTVGEKAFVNKDSDEFGLTTEYWSIALLREKSEMSRLKFWVDGK